MKKEQKVGIVILALVLLLVGGFSHFREEKESEEVIQQDFEEVLGEAEATLSEVRRLEENEFENEKVERLKDLEEKHIQNTVSHTQGEIGDREFIEKTRDILEEIEDILEN